MISPIEGAIGILIAACVVALATGVVVAYEYLPVVIEPRRLWYLGWAYDIPKVLRWVCPIMFAVMMFMQISGLHHFGSILWGFSAGGTVGVLNKLKVSRP